MPTAKHSQKATTKQLTALTLINRIDPETNKPFTKRKAMLKAGYSKRVAGNPKRLMESQAVVTLLDKFYLQLADVGINTAYIAGKYKETLDAQTKMSIKTGTDDKGRSIFETIDVPDYKSQLKALEMLKDIYNLTPSKTPPNENIKRRVTLEEFINGDIKEEEKQE